MPFDNKVYHKPANGGDIGGLAIVASISLDAIADALEAIARGEDASGHIDLIRKQSARFNTLFDDYTGWTEE